ncbi:CAMK family protein kinase [Histomonas meleagridis]|uniref:CAMK family protein kinase n=1 Tax=Histomonas meleagridis TaxID=135588 RepID=UPI003559E59A|nr:CAMK family protein kinase [Histomonas meleagridis]KAH0806918.1 CAMK family protein kinase [Histomonas meleagridis]
MHCPCQIETEDLVNTKIGEYKLIRKLGKGRFGSVYLCKSEKYNCYFAIKIVEKNASSGLIQFERETGNLGSVYHSGIISLYSFFEDNHHFYLVMEYCSGGTLLNLIQRYKHLNKVSIQFYFKQLFEVLDYCHTNNIAHRDLKPENIFLEHNGRLKVGDWGQSKIYSSSEDLLQTHCGTVSYAPPEMFSHSPYDGQASDMWSAGVCLYAAAHGRLPWPSSHEKIESITKCHFAISPDVDQEIADVINSLIVLDPKKRKTAKEGKAEVVDIAGLEKVSKTPIKNDALVDILTYCTIPSTFYFFLEEKRVSSFVEFCSKGVEPTNFMKYLRVIFIHPVFVRFVSSVFSPIITPYLLTSKKIEQPEEVLNQIYELWESKISMIPNFIRRIFNESTKNKQIDNKPISGSLILYECFFKEFVKSPQRFLVFDCHQKVPSNFFEPIMTCLQTNQDILHRFANSIQSSTLELDTSYLISSTQEIEKSIIPNSLYDSFDELATSCISSRSSKVPNFDLQKYRIKFEQPGILAIDEELLKKNMLSKREKLNFEEIFCAGSDIIIDSSNNPIYDNFVLCGNSVNLVQRLCLYQEIEHSDPIKMLNNIKNKRFNEETLIIQKNNFKKKLNQYIAMTNTPFLKLQNYIEYICIDSIKTTTTNKLTIDKYIETPKLFANEYKNQISQIKQVNSENNYFKSKSLFLAYSKFASNLLFHVYCSQRIDLSALDEKVYHFLDKAFEVMTEKVELELILNLEKIDFLAEEFNLYCNENTNPLQKFNKLMNVFYKMNIICKSFLPFGTEITEKETIKFGKLLVAYAKPRNLISVLYFIEEFLSPLGFIQTNYFTGIVYSIIQKAKEFGFYPKSEKCQNNRLAHFYYYVAVLGSNGGGLKSQFLTRLTDSEDVLSEKIIKAQVPTKNKNLILTILNCSNYDIEIENPQNVALAVVFADEVMNTREINGFHGKFPNAKKYLVGEKDSRKKITPITMDELFKNIKKL